MIASLETTLKLKNIDDVSNKGYCMVFKMSKTQYGTATYLWASNDQFEILKQIMIENQHPFL